MKKINAMFKRLAAMGGKALIPYITAGDPDLKTTHDLVLEMARRGADLIELGIPFSDPLADGPTIQAACQRALKQEVNLTKILTLVQSLRQDTDIPLVLMGYYNPILSYGLARLARDAAEIGVNGFIIPDLPGEEARDWHRAACDAGVAPIYLAAPTSGPSRIRKIGALTRGFLYYVSVTGITGARAGLPDDLKTSLAEVRSLIKCPLAVGFGISTPEQVRDLAPYVDGIVVGSAIVQRIACRTGREVVQDIGDFVAELKAPLR
ncbi:tryptophan synthase subunit alpha [Desulfobacca acetoxidans]|uniref:Tryptophan synthase alpha chain n=1 Tax=Desulfobacca acetoxidans (strain ATCC 700848 / DSM 11109 / ASRB2) TaxID=880072 RepID=F2NIM1_DESAR|nr:tryptophan synthase subunit alpha [Desulfobacca acetoxidans]AEB10496.1 Tryptophan synthase alpha chain [Desulfobacca acetoxidans DSM 11109]HAY22167.1 tryptophan synthase subunit alpha [Desulfobacterales bacterium]